jgi:hypothetical protein
MEFTVVKSPTGRREKNWLPLPDGRLIYAWKPLIVGAMEGNALQVHESHDRTPAWWALLRGSAHPFRVSGRWLALTHIAAPTAPRQYFSVLVEVTAPAWEPKACSLPFNFLAPGVEYCLSAQTYEDEVHFFVYRMDRESYVVIAKDSDVLAALTESVKR